LNHRAGQALRAAGRPFHIRVEGVGFVIDPHKELVALRRNILGMGAAVEQRVAKAIEALLDQDLDAARFVRNGENEIDNMDVEIEIECLRVLALSHPVAGDLRFVLAVLRINNELERVADLANGISKRVIAMSVQNPIVLPQALSEMAAAAFQMLHDVLNAFSTEDAEVCRRVRRADKRVDDLHKQIFAWVHREIPARPDKTEEAIEVLSIARALERIGDAASNIAEDVLFLLEGAIVRHTNV
jgi:phosphate transport system protein